MIASWVVGSNGMLGSALCRRLQKAGANLFVPTERFRWNSESELFVQLESAVKEFVAFVGSRPKWQIFWAAGIGTMNSAEEELAFETQILSNLLNLVESQPDLIGAAGCFVFASSAGAIYAGATEDVIDENTPVAPTTAYGREKIKQESLIGEFAKSNLRITVLLARISTLYGPGQSLGKQQGLISMIARRVLRKQPIQIYVPFDTIRDYITADDAAAIMIATLYTINSEGGLFVKIVASERPTTIAEILSTFKRISRSRIRVVMSANRLSCIYSHRIQFHSIAFPVNDQVCRTSLPIGIAEVVAAERTAYSKNRSFAKNLDT